MSLTIKPQSNKRIVDLLSEECPSHLEVRRYDEVSFYLYDPNEEKIVTGFIIGRNTRSYIQVEINLIKNSEGRLIPRFIFCRNKNTTQQPQSSNTRSEDKLSRIDLDGESSVKFWEVVGLLSKIPECDMNGFVRYSIADKNDVIITSGQEKKYIEALCKKGHSEEVWQYLVDSGHDLPQNILHSQLYQQKLRSIKQLEDLMGIDATENHFQKLFQENPWMIQSELVDILDARRIDDQNIADYLGKSMDGYVDIVELKRYKISATFWRSTLDHGNVVIHGELLEAITQCQNYIAEIEAEADSIKRLHSLDHTPILKPKITLLYGSSVDWSEDQKKAFRILNSSYHSLNIMTYDMLLERCKRIIEDDVTEKITS